MDQQDSEAQSEQSPPESDSDESSRAKGDGKTTGEPTKEALDVMLKLMPGMQKIQEQLLQREKAPKGGADGHEEEALRGGI